jgi:hypothetical protein
MSTLQEQLNSASQDLSAALVSLASKNDELAALQAALTSEEDPIEIESLEAQILAKQVEQSSIQFGVDALEATIETLQAAIAREALRLRLEAIPDLSLAIAKYIANNADDVEPDDSYNIAGFELDNFNSSNFWYFTNLAKPSIEELEDASDESVAEENQTRRNAKLNQLRSLRDLELKKVDVMINEVALSLRSDISSIVTLRQALLDFTETYKKVDGNAKAIIDNLDLSNISWPTL